ncbi:MAG: hypothetical protein PHY11_00705, partial [Bacilli bacterium]|nr:hypothetical protein [Bacilli bacterium]
PAQELEWYVNGTKSSQTGKSFEYTPTAVGEYAIVAKVGSVSSNTVTVKVAAQGLEIESVKFISNKILEIKGSEGASVAIEGKTIIDSSYYDLVNDLYHIELKEAIAQGSSVKITLSKDGATSTKEELYETRVFAVNAVSNAVANADGSYTVTKPYAAAGEASFSYQITTKTDNIIGTYLSTKIHTEVPEGATAINDTTKLVTLKDEDAGPSASFSVTKSTVIGDYTHTITLGEKSISIIVHVVEPEAIVGQKAKVYTDDDATTVALEKFDLAYGLYTEAATAGVQIAELGASGFGVAAETDGSYSITKPYETNTSSYAFLFTFYGEYLEAPEYVNNNYTISLTGPSAYGGEKATLTSGIETSSTGTSDALNDDCLDMYKDITANSGTSFTREVYQVINKDTPVGTYTFTLTVKTEKGETYTKDVVINIKDPVASLTSKLGSANLASYEIITTPIAYAEGTTYQIGDYVLQSTKYYRCKVADTTDAFDSTKWTELTTEAYSSTQIAVLNDAVIESSYDKDTNTYTIEKPMLASSLYKYDFSVILKNLQSTVASDEEMTADQIANYSNISFQGKVFNLSSTATQSGYKQLGTLNTSLDAYRGIKEYDATATYALNKFVIHDGSYFKCTTAISSAEAWTGEHWAAATTAEAQSIADAIAYDAANIQIYGTDVETQAQSNRVFANYTYTAVSEETGTSTTSGKAAIQLKNAAAADAQVSVSLIENATNSILSSTVAGSYSYTYEIEIGG